MEEQYGKRKWEISLLNDDSPTSVKYIRAFCLILDMEETSITHMPVIKKGRLVKSGASLVLTTPPEWARENNLQEGSEVIIEANGMLKVIAATEENIRHMNERIASIREQLASHHVTRSDEDQMGKKAQAQTNQRNTKTSDSK